MQKQRQLTAPRVVVLGGGYAGTLAALRLAPHARVTLVDPADRFTERVRRHELAAGRPDITHSRTALLRGTGVRAVTARATALDPEARTVATDDGRTLGYDRLVYALGSRTAPAPDPRAFTPETAAELHKRLQDGPGTLAVAGGGLTGIELAAELAEARPGWRVRLLTAGVLGAGLSARGRDHVRAVLGRLGVHTEEGHRVTDGTDADVLVWAGAMVPATGLARAAGLAVEESGRIAVDAALRSRSHPDIYVAGDAAAAHAPAAGALRMACATALPTGSHVATALLAEARGTEPPPLTYRFFVQCVSLGRRDGLIQAVRADDTPYERILTGRAAARTKETVVRSAYAVLRLARRRPGAARLLPWVG
ncbi:NAD(P)/FAD-dependent oxidoreductase [Streptomyces sp. NPDC053560]|uniref:NAD(P)/FAD-dependent oxidoreductase n=1 Tax=Streptomyces sp. NPDC053560 TaxID=3365711 RepID=UPI0037CE7907